MLFPNSSYLFQASHANEFRLLLPNDEKSNRIVAELAYHQDDYWRRPIWRGINAIEVAQAYETAGDLAQARTAFDRAVAVFSALPGTEAASNLTRAQASIAALAARSGDTDTALRYYELSIVGNPSNRAAIIDAYVTLVCATYPTHAPQRLTAFISSQRNDMSLLYGVVVALLKHAQVSDAEVATETFHQSASAYWQATRAVVFRAQGKYLLAETAFETALSTYIGTDNRVQAEWAVGLGIVRILQGDWRGGIQAQKYAVQLLPDSPYNWYDLAWYYSSIGEYDLAMDAISQAIALAPHNTTFVELQTEILQAVQ